VKQLYYMLGHDVMQRGLHIYFGKHAWGNTQLPDFIGALNDGYKEVGGGKLGPDFDLVQWSDSWLTTSGVNILEPLPEFNADGSLSKLQIKQSCDLRGQNQLRTHKLDVAVYDADGNQHVTEAVLVKETEELTEVKVGYTGPVAAILVNVNDHTYAKTGFDKKSMDFFENSLYVILFVLT